MPVHCIPRQILQEKTRKGAWDFVLCFPSYWQEAEVSEDFLMKLFLTWSIKNALVLPHYVVWDNTKTSIHGLENTMIPLLQLPTGLGL